MTGTGQRLLPLGGDDPAGLGPYELLGRLGSGGMGRVYLARSTADGRLAAVKTLLAEGAVGDTDRRRFAREVALAGRIDSVYTAKVRDADPDAERPWMAIDYIAAPSLAELVRVAGVLPAPAVRWIAAGTTAALFTLHREGIVHRDVKPQNILLPMSGAKVIDFGISHSTDITRTTLTLGTIAFTSPEQARGEESTAASDVYSLGATLFHLAVGRPPYPEGEDTLRLLARVSRGDLDLTGLPAALADIVHHCVAVEPGDRPQPGDLLARFATEQAAPSASSVQQQWLPASWARLIEEYASEGEELAGATPRVATVPLRGAHRVGSPQAPPARETTPVPSPPAPAPAVTPPPAGPRPGGAGAFGPPVAVPVAEALTVDGSPHARGADAPTPPPDAERRPAATSAAARKRFLTSGPGQLLGALIIAGLILAAIYAPRALGSNGSGGSGGDDSGPKVTSPVRAGQCLGSPRSLDPLPCGDDQGVAPYRVTDVVRQSDGDPSAAPCPAGVQRDQAIHSIAGVRTVVCVELR
ncbi:serine/threonine-protein kinase [Streptomyces sp. NPDC004726]